MSGCETLNEVNPFSEGTLETPPDIEVTNASPKIQYSPVIEISGSEEAEDALRSLFEDASRLVRLEDRLPTSLERLRRRAESDVERFLKILRSEGFYGGKVKYRIDEDSEPIRAVLSVETGPPFVLQRYAIDYGPHHKPPPSDFPSTAEEVDLELGGRGRTADILDAQAAITRKLGNSGYPLARIEDQKVIADFASSTLSVDISVDSGPPATFGGVRVSGLEAVERELIDDFVPWKPGDTYRNKSVQNFRESLVSTRLFSSVIAQHAEAVGNDGKLPVEVEVVERKHRSVGVGASYSTNTGFGGNVYWEHRNLFGQGEKLRLNARAAEIQQLVGATASKPAFLHPDQTLVGDLTLERNRTDAFDEDKLKSSVGLERTFSRTISGRIGVSAEYARLTDEFGENTVLLFGLPTRISRDDTDDLLNPTEGSRISFTTTPFIGQDDEAGLTLWRNELSASTYVAMDKDRRYVIAARGKIGSIGGADRRRVPASHRFYAGGGGSVRGYGFQLIGPLDDEDEPLGGRSAAEIGLEGRIRVGESFGIVPFVEGGLVDESVVPTFSNTVRWAAGIGGRYYTSFGPIRLDIAFPINPREVDDVFQFYVSLGQAF